MQVSHFLSLTRYCREWATRDLFVDFESNIEEYQKIQFKQDSLAHIFASALKKARNQSKLALQTMSLIQQSIWKKNMLENELRDVEDILQQYYQSDDSEEV